MLSPAQQARLAVVIARREQEVFDGTRRQSEAGSNGGQALFGVDEITPREIEVLSYIADGLSNDEIASRMNISVETVKSHLRHIFVKIDAKNRAQAIAIAFRAGLVV